MAVDITTSTVIDRAAADVAAYAADPSNAPEWYGNIASVEWITPPPPQVGSKVAFVARFVGRRLEYTVAPFMSAERNGGRASTT